ncbi:hypothetical protein ABQJ54_18935 [Rhodanobacter sp. Si-c]|uniref:Uncharacterized protein n=1 Tax=Rhodanobacter lycopersici TaxID=3162487 RepID=A0ABV3QJG7_9GAMM
MELMLALMGKDSTNRQLTRACESDRKNAVHRSIYRLICVANFDHFINTYDTAFARSLMYDIKSRLRHLEIHEFANVSIDSCNERLYLRVSFTDEYNIDEHLFDEMIAMTVSSRPFVINGQDVIADIAIHRIEPRFESIRPPYVALENMEI